MYYTKNFQNEKSKTYCLFLLNINEFLEQSLECPTPQFSSSLV